MANEIELKLAIQKERAEQWMRSAWLDNINAKARPVQRLENDYYDTPDLALQQARMALRIRRAGDQWIQTLKTSGEQQAGLSRRGEWESALSQPVLDLSLLPEGVLPEGVGDRLALSFTTHFTRQAWDVHTSSGSHIEIVLDQGEVAVPPGSGGRRRQDPLCELEFELKSGHAFDLLMLAQDLALHFPVQLLTISKAERGLRLLRPQETAREKSLGRLDEGMSLLSLAQQLTGHWLDCWARAHEAFAFDGQEVHLLEAERYLSRLHALSVLLARQQTSCGLGDLRPNLSWLRQHLAPIGHQMRRDRCLQSLSLSGRDALWRQGHLDYARRRQEYRQRWWQREVGEATVACMVWAHQAGPECRGELDKPWRQVAINLLDEQVKRLQLPKQPLVIEGWTHRLGALMRLETLLLLLAPESGGYRQAVELREGVEWLTGFSILLDEDNLPESLHHHLLQQSRQWMLQLGRQGQALSAQLDQWCHQVVPSSSLEGASDFAPPHLTTDSNPVAE
ncbi:hypothetical protein BFW38_01200 [Terasakiispira papahanaumokuakeensis]|uniref:CYTH domain-containing protein n=1 Tax=Terasakiispira papahanaumokuakeensis TaxID=197479 RepID=A0A1E2V5V2_9GAMM|nr:CYTH domain-containing protein [Terasakiispira papahanaumokuakeensis]ODC02361.1 hypothetical protein BFW38_01200 [Terasakiispira papahanaumokuakeensis]